MADDEDFMIKPYLILFIAILMFVVFLMISERNSIDFYNNFKHVTFYVLFEFNVRSVYKTQTRETMNILMNGVQTVMKSNVERPAVLLLLSPTGTSGTARSLCKTLALTILVTYERQWSAYDLNKICINGSKFSAFEDYWKFHKKLMKRIHNYGVVVIDKYQTVHPQVSTVLCNIADDTFSPFPRSVIILIIDINDYFTQQAIDTKSAVDLAEIYLRTSFGPFLDEETVDELLRVITGRSVIVKPEKHLENIQG